MNRAFMAGPPPFAPGQPVTIENWLAPPFNRWSFQHVRELIPTARISRGDGPVWELPRAERPGLDDVRFDLVVAKLSSWPDASSAPMRRAMIAAVKAIASALQAQ